MADPKPLNRSLTTNFIIVAVIPITFFAALTLYYWETHEMKDNARKNHLISKAVSGKVEVFLREPQAVLQSIRGMMLADPEMTYDDIEKMLDAHVRNSQLFESIYMVDASGQVIVVGLPEKRTRLRDDLLGISLGHREFIQTTINTGELTWSDTFLSLVTGKMSLALCIAVKERVLVGNFAIELLTSFIDRIKIGERLITLIIDKRGSIIIHPNPEVSGSHVNVAYLPPVHKGLKGEEITMEYSFEGESYLGSVSLIPGPGWLAVVSQTMEDARQYINFTNKMLLSVLVGGIIFSVLFALIKAKAISTPLSEFALRAKTITSGKYDLSQMKTSSLEVKELESSLMSMARAIQEREQQLMDSRESYRRLVETMTDGLGVIDEKYVLTYVNPRLSEMLGRSIEDLVGSIIFDYFDDENKEIMYKQLEKRQPGTNESYEITFTKLSGEKMHALMSPQPIFEDSIFKGSFAVIKDITDLKGHEIEIEKMNDELLMKNKELKQVLYVASHDLRTPLVNIHGFTKELALSLNDLISSMKDSDIPAPLKDEITKIIESDIPESLHYIQVSAEKMEMLLKGILTLSRLGRDELKVEEIDMNSMISDIIDNHRFRLNKYGIKIDVSSLPSCKGDNAKLNQVFSNLLDNAIKYSDSQKDCIISISGYRKDNEIVYCIKDNGIGMRPEHQNKIFEIFYQLEPNRFKGEGMGLTIAHRIIEKHKGKIWLESVFTRGTTFFVSLPS